MVSSGLIGLMGCEEYVGFKGFIGFVGFKIWGVRRVWLRPGTFPFWVTVSGLRLRLQGV